MSVTGNWVCRKNAIDGQHLWGSDSGEECSLCGLERDSVERPTQDKPFLTVEEEYWYEMGLEEAIRRRPLSHREEEAIS
jgi:hypothetical protein